MKIKNRSQAPTVSRAKVDSRSLDQGYPSLSYRYLTQNKNFNFSHFGKDQKDLQKTCEALLEKNVAITSKSWRENQALGKYEGGFELLSYSELRFHAAPSCTQLDESSKIVVFRFNSQQSRLIGFKPLNSDVLEIIGFDFDHTAYNHGS